MIIGELYFVKEYFWLLFPTKAVAAAAAAAARVAVPTTAVAARVAAQAVMRAASGPDAKWLSERYKWRYKCNVSFFEPKTYVVLLEEAERFYKLLDSNGNIGWIYCHDFSKYFELVKE